MAFVNKTAATTNTNSAENLTKGEIRYVKPKDASAGDVLVEGTYLGADNDTKFGKPNYQFRTTEGDLVIVNSTGHLEKNLPNLVQPGDYTQIILKSKEKMTKGAFAGKESYIFDILVDADRRSEKEVAIVRFGK